MLPNISKKWDLKLSKVLKERMVDFSPVERFVPWATRTAGGWCGYRIEQTWHGKVKKRPQQLKIVIECHIIVIYDIIISCSSRWILGVLINSVLDMNLSKVPIIIHHPPLAQADTANPRFASLPLLSSQERCGNGRGWLWLTPYPNQNHYSFSHLLVLTG